MHRAQQSAPVSSLNVLYCSTFQSGFPYLRSASFALSELADQPVPVYSNLWVPAIDGPALEAELAPPSLRRATSASAEVMS